MRNGKVGSARKIILTATAATVLIAGGAFVGTKWYRTNRENNIQYAERLIEKPNFLQLREFAKGKDFTILLDFLVNVVPRLENAAKRDGKIREMVYEKNGYWNITPEQLEPFLKDKERTEIKPVLEKLRKEAMIEGRRILSKYAKK